MILASSIFWVKITLHCDEVKKKKMNTWGKFCRLEEF